MVTSTVVISGTDKIPQNIGYEDSSNQDFLQLNYDYFLTLSAWLKTLQIVCYCMNNHEMNCKKGS